MTDTPPPAVSIVMAAYNGAAWIGATIDSLLAQSFRDFELIVVDDASTDDTLARLRAVADPRLVVLPSERNGGPIAARNRAFAAARGRYIAGLDQDDLCLPDRLERQVAFLDAHPGVVLLGTAMRDLLDDGRIVADLSTPAVTSPGLLDWAMHFYNPFGWSTVMMRGDALRRLPAFERPERLYAEDFDLYHRLARLGGIARIDTPLLLYRRHATSASQRFTERMMDSATAVLAEAYRPIFGPHAAVAAGRVLRQGSGYAPIRSGAELAELGQILARVHAQLLRELRPAAADLALIRQEYTRFWGTIAHRAVRAGRLSVSAALRARPPGMPLGAVPPAQLMLAGLIGGGRALRALWTPRGA